MAVCDNYFIKDSRNFGNPGAPSVILLIVRRLGGTLEDLDNLADSPVSRLFLGASGGCTVYMRRRS